MTAREPSVGPSARRSPVGPVWAPNRRADAPNTITPGTIIGARRRARNQKSAPSLVVAIVLSGSPIGVRAAPSPMAKHATTVMRTSSVRDSRMAATNSMKTRVAMIAVMTLEASPSRTMIRPTAAAAPVRATSACIPVAR